MNILFYTKRGFNPKSGGIERVSDMLAKEFTITGHTVFYVTWMEETGYEEFIPDFEQLVLSDKKEICSKTNIDLFTDFVIRHQINVIICQYSFEKDVAELPYLIKQNTGVKLLYVFHSSPDFRALALEELSSPVLPSEKLPHKQFKRITRLLLKKQKQDSRNINAGKLLRSYYERGNGLVLLSETYIPVVQRIAEINSSEKFFAVANPNTFTAPVVHIKEKENTILFVGRLSVEKRPEKAMLIWQRIHDKFPDWNLKILGVGMLRKDVEKLNKTLKLERCFIEGRQDPSAYYAKAKILLMLSDYEGFPLALTEAMQYGVTPVVFHSFKSLTDIVEDGVTGSIVKPFDLDDFEKKLTFLMENDKIREKIAMAAIESVKRFDIQLIAKKWEDIFCKIGCGTETKG